MNTYEKLMAKYDHLHIEERTMFNDGLYCDGHVWINENLATAKKLCILAEEIGHHETSSGDILDQNNTINRKQELTARRWAYENIIPKETIITALKNGYTQLWELAEHLDLDEGFLYSALRYYGILDE